MENQKEASRHGGGLWAARLGILGRTVAFALGLDLALAGKS